MKLGVNSLLSLLDVGTGFCYWLLGRDLLEDEVKRIQGLFVRVQKPDDESYLIHELNSLSPGKDLLLVCDKQNHNLVQWCILKNYSKALQVLLDYGCNPTRSGLTGYDLPLALACCLNHLEMIELLLNYGANPSGSTMLSSNILTYLSHEIARERYLRLIDLFKYRNSLTSLSIVLTFDDLFTFRLLMGETTNLSSISASSLSTSSSVNNISTIDDCQVKISENDFDIFREKLKIENYVENIISHDADECLEQQNIPQQNIITNDDMSDYVEHGQQFSFSDTLDAESALVNHDDRIQTLSDKCNQIGRSTEEETFIPRATTDGGYYTVDDSSGRVKSHPPLATLDEQQFHEIHMKENTENLCPIQSSTQTSVIHRTKSQQQLLKYLSNSNSSHRHSLPNTMVDCIHDQPSKRFRSTSSFLLSNMPNSTKHTAHLLRLLHQMIEYEAATVLDYFLKKHRTEFNEHFHMAANSSDIQLKTYELLANIKSDRIYNVLVSSNCAYFNSVTTSLCDRENNTLVHSLLAQNPLKYQPNEMIKMLERYMSNGLKEFINRPNLSNHCMIQMLLCNEYFLKMLFFPRTLQTSSKHLTMNSSYSLTNLLPIYDFDIVEKWRHSYLILIEILIKHGARIDISAGSYRNSLDCLFSSLIDLSKRLLSLPTLFDMKYLKRLIILLLSSLNSKTRSIYFKYNIERFLQLLDFIHINNDDLSDILSIVHVLLQYEYQPLRLNLNTLMHFFKSWLINPNFLCSSLIGKDLFMQQFLTILIRRLNFTANQPISDVPLIVTTTNTLSSKSSMSTTDNDICPQNLFRILINLISISQTCLQIHSIYELLLIFVNHTSIDIINNDLTQLPIVFLCTQTKLIHHCLLIPFIDLFLMVHTRLMINKTKDMLSQISAKRLSVDLYKYFLSIEHSRTTVRSLRHLATKYLYHRIQKPYHESITSLPISETIKERLIHFHDI